MRKQAAPRTPKTGPPIRTAFLTDAKHRGQLELVEGSPVSAGSPLATHGISEALRIESNSEDRDAWELPPDTPEDKCTPPKKSIKAVVARCKKKQVPKTPYGLRNTTKALQKSPPPTPDAPSTPNNFSHPNSDSVTTQGEHQSLISVDSNKKNETMWPWAVPGQSPSPINDYTTEEPCIVLPTGKVAKKDGLHDRLLDIGFSDSEPHSQEYESRRDKRKGKEIEGNSPPFKVQANSKAKVVRPEISITDNRFQDDEDSTLLSNEEDIGNMASCAKSAAPARATGLKREKDLASTKMPEARPQRTSPQHEVVSETTHSVALQGTCIAPMGTSHDPMVIPSDSSDAYSSEDFLSPPRPTRQISSHFSQIRGVDGVVEQSRLTRSAPMAPELEPLRKKLRPSEESPSSSWLDDTPPEPKLSSPTEQPATIKNPTVTSRARAIGAQKPLTQVHRMIVQGLSVKEQSQLNDESPTGLPSESQESYILGIRLVMEEAIQLLLQDMKSKEDPLNGIVADYLHNIGRMIERLTEDYARQNDQVAMDFDRYRKVCTNIHTNAMRTFRDFHDELHNINTESLRSMWNQK